MNTATHSSGNRERRSERVLLPAPFLSSFSYTRPRPLIKAAPAAVTSLHGFTDHRKKYQSWASTSCPVELHTLSAFPESSTKTDAQGQDRQDPVLKTTQPHLVTTCWGWKPERKMLWDKIGISWPTTLKQGPLDGLVAQKQSEAFKTKITAVNSFCNPCPRFVFYSGI